MGGCTIKRIKDIDWLQRYESIKNLPADDVILSNGNYIHAVLIDAYVEIINDIDSYVEQNIRTTTKAQNGNTDSGV